MSTTNNTLKQFLQNEPELRQMLLKITSFDNKSTIENIVDLLDNHPQLNRLLNIISKKNGLLNAYLGLLNFFAKPINQSLFNLNDEFQNLGQSYLDSVSKLQLNEDQCFNIKNFLDSEPELKSLWKNIISEIIIKDQKLTDDQRSDLLKLYPEINKLMEIISIKNGVLNSASKYLQLINKVFDTMQFQSNVEYLKLNIAYYKALIRMIN